MKKIKEPEYNSKDHFVKTIKYNAKILLVDDNVTDLNLMSQLLKNAGYKNIFIADNLNVAKKYFENEKPYIAVVDYRLDPMPEGVHIELFHSINPSIPLLIVTAYGSLKIAIECMKTGAHDFLSKPFNPESFQKKIDDLLLFRYMQEQTIEHRRKRKEEIIIGISDKIIELYNILDDYSLIDLPVLICGENGTGKELVAKTLHDLSDRKAHPMITVNCAAIPEHLLESELFGCVKGAYTDANMNRKGYVGQAGYGTLFLDEISELSFSMQAKILELIEHKLYRQVGNDQLLRCNSRILAATNLNITEEIKKGRFKSGLYHRLSILDIYLPPLRDRNDDIPLLVRHFINKHGKQFNKSVIGFTDEAIKLLIQYNWPGNIRELENVVLKCLVLTDKEWIEKDILISEFDFFDLENSQNSFKESKNRVLNDFEQNYLISLLEYSNGNVSKAGRISGIPHKTLWRKLTNNKINPEQFR